MNETNFEHAIYAVLLQIAVGVLTGNWWIGAAAGVFFFLGREHAQFERKLAVAGGTVGTLNPLAGFQLWKWSLDSQLDLAFPVAATLLVALGWHLGVSVPFVALFAALVLLNVADAVLTVRVLDGGGRELNPIMAKAMSWIGVVPALVVVKVVALAAFYVGLGVQAPDWVYTPHVTAGLCGFYGLVVCNNWRLVAAQA